MSLSESFADDFAEFDRDVAGFRPPVVAVVLAYPDIERVAECVVCPDGGRVATLVSHEARPPEHTLVVLYIALGLVYILEGKVVPDIHAAYQPEPNGQVVEHIEVADHLADVLLVVCRERRIRRGLLGDGRNHIIALATDVFHPGREPLSVKPHVTPRLNYIGLAVADSPLRLRGFITRIDQQPRAHVVAVLPKRRGIGIPPGEQTLIKLLQLDDDGILSTNPAVQFISSLAKGNGIYQRQSYDYKKANFPVHTDITN